MKIGNGEIYQVNQKGYMEIGGVSTLDLVRRYGTPLFVYDVALIRKNCREFVNAFKDNKMRAQVAYASKAFSTIGMLQVIHQEGLSLDVVSMGELYTALQAGFPPEKIHMHGNNKSKEELEMAIKHHIGCIIVDNFYEIELLNSLLSQHVKEMNILIRVTPGVNSETHDYIMTGNEDSKFGFNIENNQAEEAFKLASSSDYINVVGLHSHIGSQIFNTEGFTKAIEILFKEVKCWNEKYGFEPKVLNLGGGFGIRYTEKDEPLPLSEYVNTLTDAVKKNVEKLGISLPEIWIEPGRSIVGNAGITLYTIGSKKEIPGVRNYLAVDGGMTDNLRPALYQAEYTGIIANKADQPKTEIVSIAGKCCESGDMLIYDLPIAKAVSGDILAVFSTGAYGYAMASHYNRFAKPPVVFIENKQDKLVVKRETKEDIVRNDLSYL